MRRSISSAIAIASTFAVCVRAGFNVTIVYVDAPDCACQNDMSLAAYSSSTTWSSTTSSTSPTSLTSSTTSTSSSRKTTSTSTMTEILTVTYTVATGLGYSSTVGTAIPSALSASFMPPGSVTTTASVVPIASVAPASSVAVAPVAPNTGKTGTSQALSSVNDGQATFYGGNVAGGMCSFSTYSLPAGILGTALSDSNWNDAGLCGACVSVKGPDGNFITAMVVDQCPGCGPNHLDLFPNAFSTLANPTTGIIPVSWNVVPCPVSGPITLRNKEGTSAFWFSMQVLNAAKPVTKLEVSTDNGATWQPTERKEYNFFEHQTGFGSGALTVRVTDQTGGVVVVNNVQVASGTAITGPSNF